jgi:hypothetical protein
LVVSNNKKELVSRVIVSLSLTNEIKRHRQYRQNWVQNLSSSEIIGIQYLGIKKGYTNYIFMGQADKQMRFHWIY